MFIKKQMLFIIFTTVNNFGYPVLAVAVLSIAIFNAKMSISVSVFFAIKQLLEQLNKYIEKSTDVIETYIEFLVSMNRVQDFLL